MKFIKVFTLLLLSTIFLWSTVDVFAKEDVNQFEDIIEESIGVSTVTESQIENAKKAIEPLDSSELNMLVEDLSLKSNPTQEEAILLNITNEKLGLIYTDKVIFGMGIFGLILLIIGFGASKIAASKNAYSSAQILISSILITWGIFAMLLADLYFVSKLF